MSRRIRRMTAREVESLLRQNGFELVSQKGSHRKWRNASLAAQVIVPYHRGQILPIGTLQTILENSKMPEDQWRP